MSDKIQIIKVLIINGSPRKQGNTAVALDEVARQLAVNGIGSETMWIGNMPFQMMNMPLVTSQYWNIVYGRKPAPGRGVEPWDPMQFIR